MPKTTAKVRHRDYIPFGWIAVKFCNVDFYGFRAKEMTEKWSDITNKRFIAYYSLYEENETKIKNMRDKARGLNEQVKSSKPFYRFWYNKAEKEMLSEAKELSIQANQLEEKNEKIRHQCFFDVYECHRKIENLLQQNGFVLTSIASEGDRCITEIEIWTLDE